MELVQNMWESITLPTELICTILVLLPKANVDIRGIGMIEALCKVLEAIIDTRIKTVVVLHDALHVFCTRRGTGAAMMEIKIAQDLASINQDSLFLVFLDICKAYETLERSQLIQEL